jgi:MSHA biogenesis protein MshM
MASLDESFVTALVQNPAIQPRSLMLAIADELGIELERYIDQHMLLKSIYYRLVELAREHKRVVVCIDEAQAMPLETMETLRLLTNLETEKRKLLQIVLFGQPELNRKLEETSIRQLAQRITFHYHLSPMPSDEFHEYVEHRLATAGYSGEGPLFTAPAMRALHRASKGVPRIAHVLAHKALLAAFGKGAHEVRFGHVRSAAKDTLVTAARRSRWHFIGALGLSLASVGAAAWTFLK